MAFRNFESKFNNFSFTNPFNKSRKIVDTSDLKINKYFAIDSIATGKSLSVRNGFEGLICDFKGGDHQLWYWEGKCLRNKKYENDNLPGIQLVLELHKSDYEKTGWGKVYLSHKHEEANQIWTVIQDEIECNYRGIRLDVKDGINKNGTTVGCCYPSNIDVDICEERKQKWNIRYV